MVTLAAVMGGIGAALGATAGTTAAVVAGTAATAAVVGGTAAAVGTIANKAGKAKGAERAVSALTARQNVTGASGESVSAGSSDETGTNKTRSLALYGTGNGASSGGGILGNATVGRRSLLAA